MFNDDPRLVNLSYFLLAELSSLSHSKDMKRMSRPASISKQGTNNMKPLGNDLDQLFTQHYSRLLAWCRKRYAARAIEPEELVHLAYLRCRRTWRRSRCSQHGGIAYAYRALRWVALDLLRANARRRRNVSSQVDLDCMAARSGFPPESDVQESLACLSSRSRKICEHILAGDSFEGIRHEMGMTSGAFAVTLSRSKATLVVSAKRSAC